MDKFLSPMTAIDGNRGGTRGLGAVTPWPGGYGPQKQLSDDFYACQKFLSLCLWKLKKAPFINHFLLQSIYKKLLV